MKILPFETQFGNINPGQACVVVTCSSKRVHMRKGTYLGYIESGTYIKAKVKVETTKFVTFLVDTGEVFNWKKDYNAATFDFKKIKSEHQPVMAVITLQLNRIIPLTAHNESQDK